MSEAVTDFFGLVGLFTILIIAAAAIWWMNNSPRPTAVA